MRLTARGNHRVLAFRTIADLDGVENIMQHHIAEASRYRAKDQE